MDFFKKNAGSKIEVRNQHSQKHLKEMYLPDPIRRIPTEGYVTIKSVLSDHTAVLFAVPSHEWNELVESKEWRDFQALLEKTQEAFYQQKPPTAEQQWEIQDYRETYDQQLPFHAHENIILHTKGIFLPLIHDCLEKHAHQLLQQEVENGSQR